MITRYIISEKAKRNILFVMLGMEPGPCACQASKCSTPKPHPLLQALCVCRHHFHMLSGDMCHKESQG